GLKSRALLRQVIRRVWRAGINHDSASLAAAVCENAQTIQDLRGSQQRVVDLRCSTVGKKDGWHVGLGQTIVGREVTALIETVTRVGKLFFRESQAGAPVNVNRSPRELAEERQSVVDQKIRELFVIQITDVSRPVGNDLLKSQFVVLARQEVVFDA